MEEPYEYEEAAPEAVGVAVLLGGLERNGKSLFLGKLVYYVIFNQVESSLAKSGIALPGNAQ